MLYEFDLTIPANTLPSAPLKLDVVLDAGVITGVQVQIPNGCVGLTHARVYDGNHQLWPSNPDNDFKGSGHVLDWRESYPLEREPFSLTLVGWNNDDTYQHTITFRFELAAITDVVPEDEGQQPLTLADILAGLA